VDEAARKQVEERRRTLRAGVREARRRERRGKGPPGDEAGPTPIPGRVKKGC